jgi:hypothetical protein
METSTKADVSCRALLKDAVTSANVTYVEFEFERAIKDEVLNLNLDYVHDGE